jgi:hypothetical protein
MLRIACLGFVSIVKLCVFYYIFYFYLKYISLLEPQMRGPTKHDIRFDVAGLMEMVREKWACLGL